MVIPIAYRASNERRRAGEGTIPRRIVRTIFRAGAASAVIATFGLTTAGTAHAATGRVQVFYGDHSAGYDHYAGYDTASSNNWLFWYVATTVPVQACRIAP